jgi:hypothetical protein
VKGKKNLNILHTFMFLATYLNKRIEILQIFRFLAIFLLFFKNLPQSFSAGRNFAPKV